MHRNRIAVLTLCSAFLSAIGAECALAAVRPGVPEQQSLQISRILRPIPDEEWQDIAGVRAAQTYTIVRGDTLYGISERLFGDARYWPKIWALNNNTITNPHLIRPGRAIAFLPGTGVSLPAVAMGAIEDAYPSPPQDGTTFQETPLPRDASPTISRRSQEWKLLPPQPWENVTFTLPPEVDPQGFDRRTRISFGRGRRGFELPSVIQSERMDYLGEITGAREESRFLGMGDRVFIRSDGNIHVGETYAITANPVTVQAGLFARTGYAYLILGSVRITGVKDQVFVGNITSSKHPIERGAKLITHPPRAFLREPVPGPGPMEATLFVDQAYSTFVTAQHKQVFVDRGTDDGIQPGMVFRYFEYRDPATQKLISESGLVRSGDIIVVQVSPRFSSGIVISSRTTLPEKATVTLLTDISELFPKGRGDLQDIFEAQPPPTSQEIDTLEQLDTGAGLGRGEARELRQLEKFEEPPLGYEIDEFGSEVFETDETMPGLPPEVPEDTWGTDELVPPPPADTTGPSFGPESGDFDDFDGEPAPPLPSFEDDEELPPPPTAPDFPDLDDDFPLPPPLD